MAITVTQIASTDPRYDPNQDLFEISGDPQVGKVVGMPTPFVASKATMQNFLAQMQNQQAAAAARFNAPVAAANEIITALLAAGAQ